MAQNYPLQRVIVYVDGFNFYYGIHSHPWNKLYFPPNHKSSSLRTLAGGKPTYLERYEGRFKRALMPDEIKLKSGFVIRIPEKWKLKRERR